MNEKDLITQNLKDQPPKPCLKSQYILLQHHTYGKAPFKKSLIYYKLIKISHGIHKLQQEL